MIAQLLDRLSRYPGYGPDLSLGDRYAIWRMSWFPFRVYGWWDDGSDEGVWGPAEWVSPMLWRRWRNRDRQDAA